MKKFYSVSRSLISDLLLTICPPVIKCSPLLRFELYIVFIISCITIVTKLYLLLSTPYPQGSDGYAYLVQLRSLIETIHLHYPDPSLIYPFLAGIALFAGATPLTLKIGITILILVFVIAVYLYSRTVTNNWRLAAIIATWAALSPNVLFAASQFPKQFMGVTLFILFLVALRSRRRFLAITLIPAVLLTHRMTAVMLLIYAVLSTALHVKRRSVVVIIISAIACAIMIGLLPHLVPGSFNFFDFSRLDGTLSAVPQFAPISFFRMRGNNLSEILFCESILLYLVIILSVVYIAKRFIRTKGKIIGEHCILTIIAAISIFPFLVIDPMGAGYRLFLIAMVMEFIMLPHLPIPDKKRILIPSFIIIAISGIIYTTTEKVSRYDPPSSLYQMLTQKAGTKLSGIPLDLIVAHKVLAEMIDYHLRIDALAWRPEPYFDRTRVWRMVYGIERWEIARNANVGETDHRIIDLSANYILVREDLWDLFLNQITDDDLFARSNSAENPYQVRPSYITYGRR
jgi:hypothetical protein